MIMLREIFFSENTPYPTTLYKVSASYGGDRSVRVALFFDFDEALAFASKATNYEIVQVK
jgi:hypothetical protein